MVEESRDHIEKQLVPIRNMVAENSAKLDNLLKLFMSQQPNNEVHRHVIASHKPPNEICNSQLELDGLEDSLKNDEFFKKMVLILFFSFFEWQF